MDTLNPNFEKYIKGFKKVYKKHFNKEPTMSDYIFNGWLDVKDIPSLNFEEMGRIHAEILIKKGVTMFEKEAEEYAEKKICQEYTDGCMGFYKCKEDCERYHNTQKYWKDGAEFGYNKANEWHYVNWKYFADKDYPKSEVETYLVQLRNKNTLICEWETEEGFGCFWDSNLEPIDNDDVYAWKEIVLPSEPMRSLDKEEQKNYTKAINKVYKPTGVKLFDKENE